MLKPNEDIIEEVFSVCVIARENLVDTAKDDLKIVNGVDDDYYFSRSKLRSCKADIIEQVSRLSERFDDGRPVNQASYTEDGIWGHGDVAYSLILLGMAIGVIEYSLPRPLWYLLPGGTPYVRRRLPVVAA